MDARKLYLLLVILLCSSIVPISTVWAQNTTGTISGVVKDSSGAVVPSASVHVSSAETGFTRDTKTDEAGEYKLPLVPIGVYTVAVSYLVKENRATSG